MTLIEREPLPRSNGASHPRSFPDWPILCSWEEMPAPQADFMVTLAGRRSAAGGPLAMSALAAILEHATALRHRGQDGRFGTWESRPAPSAGGLHAIGLLCLPFDPDCPAGLYDPDRRALRAPDRLDAARKLNRESAALLASVEAGTTVQLVADYRRYGACYDAPDSLILRDAGAMCATLALVASAIGLRSVLLGRLGTDIVRAAGLQGEFTGVGAIHLGSDAAKG